MLKAFRIRQVSNIYPPPTTCLLTLTLNLILYDRWILNRRRRRNCASIEDIVRARYRSNSISDTIRPRYAIRNITCGIVSYRILSYLILSYLILSHFISFHFISSHLNYVLGPWSGIWRRLHLFMSFGRADASTGRKHCEYSDVC
jgi:hypothetical protein